MQNAYVVTGTLTDEKTVKLDEAVPVQMSQVRLVLVIEPLTTPARRPAADVLAEIWEGQQARGHVPPTRDEVDTYLKAERDSWDDHRLDRFPDIKVEVL